MLNNNVSKVNKILWIILFANVAVALLKVIIGSMIKSVSMTADGFHSLTDGSSNIVGLIGVWLASRPADEDHPYGHKKFETLASLFIAGMLFVISIKIIVDAVSRFVDPVSPTITIESLLTMVITLVINILVARYEYKQGKALDSNILISDSMHTKSDIYVSCGVLTTLLLIRFGAPAIIDPIISLVVSIFILIASYEIFNLTSCVLVDKAAVDIEKIKELALTFEQVKNIHKVRSRGSDNDLYIDMHIMVEPLISVEESHALTHNIERKLRQELNENIQLIIHIEPFYGQS